MLDTFDDFLDIESIQSFGHYLTCICPFHESYPVRNSLFIYKDFWICQSCGKKGADHNYLLQALNSGSTIHFEQKKFVNPWNKWIRDYGSVFGACQRGYQSLKNFPQQKYYLKKRGLSETEIKSLKLGYLEGHYLFPIIHKDGNVFGVCRKGEGFLDKNNKYITPSKQDNKRLIYVPGGWYQFKASRSVFLAFGILSAVSLFLMGKTACSTLSGTILDPACLEEIDKPIYIIPDWKEEDKAYKLANELGWRGRVIIPDYTDELLDPNDLFIHNVDSLRSSLDGLPT